MKPVKLEGGRKIPLKTIYLNERGGSAGYFSRLDIPGTLKTLVREDGKFNRSPASAGGRATRTAASRARAVPVCTPCTTSKIWSS